MNPSGQKTIRVAPATVVIFSILFLPSLFAGVVTLFKSAGQLFTGLFLCALYPVSIYLICVPTVVLDREVLTYRALFTRRSFDLSEVVSVAVSARPAPTLELRAPASSRQRPLAFIIKPFSRSGVACIMQHIRTFSPKARFESIGGDLLQADFTSVTKETLSTRNLVRIAMTVGGVAMASAIFRATNH